MSDKPAPPRAFIPYEIPLSDGETARLVLPAVMTKQEASRLCDVIQALAFDDDPPGSEEGRQS